MKNGARFFTMMLASLVFLAPARNSDTLKTVIPVRAIADSARKPADTLLHTVTVDPSIQMRDSLSTPALAPAAAPAPQKINLVKRSYNGRQQVLLACGMMIFVVAMFTAAQNWNPK
jgi:hypothetical protein